MTVTDLELQTIGVKEVRKKPVKVKAVEITEQNYERIVNWIRSEGSLAEPLHHTKGMMPEGPGIWIRTFEDWRYGAVGDVIIRGSEGEFYPIKSIVYKNVYEDVVQVPNAS